MCARTRRRTRPSGSPGRPPGSAGCRTASRSPLGATARPRGGATEAGSPPARLSRPNGGELFLPGARAMLAFKTILHPTDFSEQSSVAFQLACALARDHGARLIVLHVAEEPVTIGDAEGLYLPALPIDWEAL